MYVQTNKLTVVKEDFNALISYIEKNKNSASFMDGASLLGNIEHAEVLEEEDFPWEVVRLNTRVVIRDKEARYNFTYTVVLPEEADHRKCKVSVLSPIGSALFGYRRGDDTFWLTPTGKRYFTIMAVAHERNS
jgi:transcription elongation GreA/GreB family factor